MGQIHPNRSAFTKDGIISLGAAFHEFAADSQRLVGRVPHAKHPLISADIPDASPHLVGQGLEREPVISRRGCRTQTVRWTLNSLGSEKGIDRFFKTTVKQLFKAFEWDQAATDLGRALRGEFPWQVETVQRIKEKQGANPFVKVVSASTEPVEGISGIERLGERGSAREGIERPVANSRIGRRDDFDQRMGAQSPLSVPKIPGDARILRVWLTFACCEAGFSHS
jgi:hypothetical protein